MTKDDDQPKAVNEGVGLPMIKRKKNELDLASKEHRTTLEMT